MSALIDTAAERARLDALDLCSRLDAAMLTAPRFRGGVCGQTVEAMARSTFHEVSAWNLDEAVSTIHALLDEIDRLTAALAAAPQPAPMDRQALVGVILDAMLGRYPGRDMARAIADALIAAGLCLPGPQPDETLAWAVVGESGRIDVESIAIDPDEVRLAPQPMQRVVRVAIRCVEDEA